MLFFLEDRQTREPLPTAVLRGPLGATGRPEGLQVEPSSL